MRVIRIETTEGHGLFQSGKAHEVMGWKPYAMSPPDEDAALQWDRTEHDGPMYFACTWAQFRLWVGREDACHMMVDNGLILTVLDVTHADPHVGSEQVTYRKMQAAVLCCFFPDTPWGELEAFIEGDV